VTARDGATLRLGASRFLNISRDGALSAGLGVIGNTPILTATDSLGTILRSREDDVGAPYGLVILNDVIMPTGVPLLKIGIGVTDTTIAEYFRIDDDGDVGIGDDTPDGTLLLDVEGQIGATQYCDEKAAAITSITTPEHHGLELVKLRRMWLWMSQGILNILVLSLTFPIVG